MCPTPDDGRDPKERSAMRPESGSGSDDGSALSPDDLDIEDQENVVQIEQDRYVIGTDQRPNVPDDAEDAGSDEDVVDPAGSGELGSDMVKEWLEDDLEETSARYGFHLTAKSDGAINHQQLFSEDVGTVFDGLLRWYAEQLTDETAVEDVLGILLTESNVRVRYSPSCLQAILKSYNLGPDDTIADLFEAVQDDRGMVFPPENV